MWFVTFSSGWFVHVEPWAGAIAFVAIAADLGHLIVSAAEGGER